MRNARFDVLKGIAIIAVVLYHLGVCKYGYLGVDAFLVIAGYFTMASVQKTLLQPNRGGYLNFVTSRITRLLPLLLIAGLFSFLLGLFLMLPDDFENLSNSIVATNFFSNNILQCITTKNYWDVVNDYKPLMHTWYVGLIMHFYLIIPLIYFLAARYFGSNRKTFVKINISIFVLSLLMYLFLGTDAEKFYYLPYRLFEFCAGALVYDWASKIKKQNKSIKMQGALSVTYVLLLLILFVNEDFISGRVRLITTVLLTSLLLYAFKYCETNIKLFSNKLLSVIGASSFSIFVWHQVIFAFTRYSFTNDLVSFDVVLIMFAIIIVLSYLSYKYIERMKINRITLIAFSILFIFMTTISLYIHKRAGVIRDVPELEVVKDNAHRGMWAEYCDRGYEYDKDFSSEDKPHWFIIGNSFGRDMVNSILESDVADKVEISYSNDVRLSKEHTARFDKADIVFLSTLGVNEETIEEVKKRVSANCKYYIIGEKNFGECNGQVYRKRFDDDYFEQTIKVADRYTQKNEILKNMYSDIYIDILGMVSCGEGIVRVFTDDGRFISQDCRHLTKAGAQYYAKLINWGRFLE